MPLGLLPDGLADRVPQAIGKVGVLISVLVAERHLDGNGRPVNHFKPEGQQADFADQELSCRWPPLRGRSRRMGSGTIAARAATTPRPTARIARSHVHLLSRWAGLGARGCVNSSGRRIRLLDRKHSRNARNVRYHVPTGLCRESTALAPNVARKVRQHRTRLHPTVKVHPVSVAGRNLIESVLVHVTDAPL